MKKNKDMKIAASVLSLAAIGTLLYRKVASTNFGDIVIDSIPQKATDALRIISFNLRYNNDKAGSVKSRSKIVSAIIRQYSPDSFGVQEATGKWMDILGESLGDKYAFVATARDDTGYESERNAVFYLKDKYNLLDSGTIWLSETPQKENSKSFASNCTRIATWAVLENRESLQRYTHLNTHLDHIYESTRVKQAEVLIGKLTQLQAENKVICTGDFNTYPTSEVYEKMTKFTNDTRASAISSDTGVTFHNYGKFDYDNIGPIDYIFAPKSATVHTHKIIRNTVKGMYPSDHYPIVADIVME